MATDLIHFDFNEFQKIEDILFLDEPILTHMVRYGKNYFQYLVETKEASDIILMFEVSEEEIHNYLTHCQSLHDIITGNQGFIFIIEQDFNGIVLETDITISSALKNDYLPAIDSFLEYQPSVESYYFNFIEQYQKKGYLRSLRDRAFYVKFALKTGQFSTTIGFNELANDFLSNVSSSFKSFLKADFTETFKQRVSDQSRLNKSFNKLLPYLDYRMVDLNFKSFEIGLAVDTVMKASIEDKHMRQWAEDVGYKYKDVVLDEEFDEEDVREIIAQYSEDDRRRIFEPIFKITQNSEYSLQIKNKKNSDYTTIKPPKSSFILRLTPPKLVVIDDETKDFEIVNVTAVRDKNSKSATLRLDGATLFNSTDMSEYTITEKDFTKYGYKVNSDISIPVLIKAEKDRITLVTTYDGNPFNRYINSVKLEDAIKDIVKAIYEYILNRPE